jgi:hypothetical protein
MVKMPSKVTNTEMTAILFTFIHGNTAMEVMASRKQTKQQLQTKRTDYLQSSNGKDENPVHNFARHHFDMFIVSDSLGTLPTCFTAFDPFISAPNPTVPRSTSA